MPPTILLVDDSDGIRELCTDVLTAAGFRVLSASSVEQAMWEIDRAPGRIDVLLSDITMPNRSALGLATALKARWPHLRVLLMSGSEPEAPAPLPFLPKPFSPAVLVSRVRDLLADDR
ncbi:MAG: response regulator [Vicinamibacterales bacterium]